MTIILQKNLIQPSSARALRQSLKETQANDTHLRLYLNFGQQLFTNGWSVSAATSLLNSLCNLLSAQHAVLAIENSGKLVIYTQVGQTLPVGARIPMMGILAMMLKNPVQFSVHENKNTQLWTHGDINHHECLIPIALGQHGKGIIALSGKKLVLNQAEIEALEATSGLIALAISQHQGPVRSETDLSILETLTPREREILALLPRGLSNNELGVKLGIASGTAKIHVERVLNKLGVKDRTQAAVKAVELGYRS
ncbi:MAG: LuxR C-terminal-related transcriptional regulator [Methylotenera sp.]|uniref:response regulator transcription factor n=1 Tax=Methylotenera sp. TaxID=2051956 RepID=UPI002486D335|nr:LuxR C-terminal-related transcriptional regulator [Methylotenera sp.]MDI1309698.1 LuxR C-terminal-related transcriptional regulator [Methylotenera sp.]